MDDGDCIVCEVGNVRDVHTKYIIGTRTSDVSKKPLTQLLSSVLDMRVTQDMWLCTICYRMVIENDYRDEGIPSPYAPLKDHMARLARERGDPRAAGKGKKRKARVVAKLKRSSNDEVSIANKVRISQNGQSPVKSKHRKLMVSESIVVATGSRENIGSIEQIYPLETKYNDNNIVSIDNTSADEAQPECSVMMPLETSDSVSSRKKLRAVSPSVGNFEGSHVPQTSATIANGFCADDISISDNHCSDLPAPISVVIKTEDLSDDNCDPDESIIDARTVHIISADQADSDNELADSEDCDIAATGEIHDDGTTHEIKEPISGAKVHPCQCCDRTFRTLRGLNKHCFMHFKNKPVSCKICNHVASSDRTIETHMKKVHDKVPELPCTFCDERFVLESSVNQHTKNLHRHRANTKVSNLNGNIGSNSNRRNHICPICNDTFYGLRSLNIHNKEVHGGQKYRCQYCPFQTTSILTLTRHDASVHKQNNVLIRSCTICEKTFQNVALLEAHSIESHSLPKIHLCKLCGSSFATLDMLYFHKKSHIPYNCSYCHLGFKKKDSLQSHIDTVHNHDTLGGVAQELLRGGSGVFSAAATAPQTVLSPAKVVSISKVAADTPQVIVPKWSAASTINPKQGPGIRFSVVSTNNPKPASNNVDVKSSHTNLENYNQVLADEYVAKMRGCHANEKVQCIFCFKDVTVGHLRIHFKKHSGEAPYACQFCEKRCIQSTNLRKHIRNKHPEHYDNATNKKSKKKLIKCESCSYVSDNVEKLEMHLWNHLSEKKFQCESCDMKFGMEATFNEHKKTHYFKEHKSCEFCNRKFRSIGYYDIHLEKCSNKWKCPLCQQYCKNEMSYRKHVKFDHPSEDITKYCCPYEGCDRIYYVKHRYDDHLISHEKEKRFCCPLCPKKFKRLRPMKDHVANFHHEHCVDCNVPFPNFADLIVHRKSEHIDKMHSCQICAFIFSNKKTLKNHLQMYHPSDEKFKFLLCNYCDDVLDSEASLKNHCLKHTGGTQICSVYQCYESFSDEESCESHIMQHETINYSCAICQVKLYSEVSLIEHMNHHGFTVHKCSLCYQSFYDKGYCDQHLQMHYPDQKYTFDCCGFATPNRFWCVSHVKEQHKYSRAYLVDECAMSVRVYRCSVCDCLSDSEQEIRSHIEEHLGNNVDAESVAIVEQKKLSDLSTVEDTMNSCPCCGVSWPNLEFAHAHLTESDICASTLQQLSDSPVTDSNGDTIQYIMLNKEHGANILVALPFAQQDRKNKVMVGGDSGQLVVFQNPPSNEDSGSEHESQDCDPLQVLIDQPVSSDQLAALLNNNAQIIISQDTL